MNTVHLCNPTVEEPFDSFVEGTTTYVCFPEGAECQLYVSVNAPGRLKIESQGVELRSTPVDPTTRCFPLNEILGLYEPLRPPPSLLFSLAHRLSERSRRVSEFSVVITQNERNPEVAATYNFKLLDPRQYEAACADSLGRRRRSVDQGQSIAIEMHSSTDQLDQHRCWNCNEPLPGTPCRKCGADPE